MYKLIYLKGLCDRIMFVIILGVLVVIGLLLMGWGVYYLVIG